MVKRALISVWFKDGVTELGRFLSDNGVQLISTGGTKKILEKEGLPVTPVSDITGTGSVMGGRVKTLDPRIFGGILADRQNPDHMDDLLSIGGKPIQIIVVNFYPFVEEAVKKGLDFREAVEFIDIGGPSMIRAAAKNYHSVIPLCSPDQYPDFMELYKKYDGVIPLSSRQKYAERVFRMTYEYEKAIYDFFSHKDQGVLPQRLGYDMNKTFTLRYGENPHQQSAFYLPQGALFPLNQLQGKELSYNNYADIESAINIPREFKKPACVIIKHSNPCGFALDDSLCEAWKRAVTTDPVSYFGGIVGFNETVNSRLAELLMKPFLECIVAPAFTDEAREILKKKKNLRVIIIPEEPETSRLSVKSVLNGFLVQERDSDQGEMDSPRVTTRRLPEKKELSALKLGWKMVRFVKSNAIVLANHQQLLGVGAGQMSRVDSVKIAIRKSREAGLSLEGAIMASDAFFPFPDSVELAAEAGITAIVQPGGSIKDKEVIEKADELNIAMVMTGKRHFYH